MNYKKLSGNDGSKLYQHNIRLEFDKYFFIFNILTNNETEITSFDQLITALTQYGYNYYSNPLLANERHNTQGTYLHRIYTIEGTNTFYGINDYSGVVGLKQSNFERIYDNVRRLI